MFTTKQFKTYLTTLGLCLGLYFIYAHTLGRVTDFPVLEADWTHPMADDDLDRPETITRRESEIAAIKGFGPNCDELEAAIILESQRKGGKKGAGRVEGLFIYAHDYEIHQDDPKLVDLFPFSAVNIKASTDGKDEHDEINTIRGDRATLEFDQPVELTKLSRAKPVGGWVEGREVILKTNRGTREINDDIVVFTQKLHYRESRHLIWTQGKIRLVVHDTKHEPTTIEGEGMELELYPPPKKGAVEIKRKVDAKRVRLFKKVRFDMMVDEEADFLGTSMEKPSTTAPLRADQPPRVAAPMTVKAAGPFDFNLETNRARFRNSVQVDRANPPKNVGDEPTYDQLFCESLTLQFRERNADETKAAKEARAGLDVKQGMKLQTMTASGKDVVLLSDTQKLRATGNYLFYDAELRRAVLRGKDEMLASQDNAYIHASNLIIEQGEKRGVQKITADGPNGWLEVIDKEKRPDGNEDPQLKVNWQGKLVMTPVPASDKREVEITRGVELELPRERVALQSETLRIILAPVEKSPAEINPLRPVNAQTKDTSTTARGNEARGDNSTKLEPILLDAIGNVSAHSEDTSIVTEKLLVNILHQSRETADGTKNSEDATAEAGNKSATTNNADSKSKPKGLPTKPGTKGATVKSAEKNNRGPLDVRAQTVVATVAKIGNKSNLLHAHAQGSVTVIQPPTAPGKDAFEVQGDVLVFERAIAGDKVSVSGNDKRPALLKRTDMTLTGLRIWLNELENQVNVEGRGYLIMESDTELTGRKTRTEPALSAKHAKAPKPIRIDWEKSMDFNGQTAYFETAVKALQDDAEIRCQNMIVNFEEQILFKQAREKKQNAKANIATITCDKDVVVIDGERQGDIYVRYTNLLARQLDYNHRERTTNALGPGVVRIIDRKLPEKNKEGKLVPPEFPFQLTLVKYMGRMDGNDINRTVKFYEDVDVLHTPITETQLETGQVPKIDALPKDGMNVESERAEMTSRDGANGRKFSDFTATIKVHVKARNYEGDCDRLSYDQEKDQLILEGTEGRMVKFYKQEHPGARPDEGHYRRLTYMRKAGQVIGDKSSGFNIFDPNEPKKR